MKGAGDWCYAGGSTRRLEAHTILWPSMLACWLLALPAGSSTAAPISHPPACIDAQARRVQPSNDTRRKAKLLGTSLLAIGVPPAPRSVVSLTAAGGWAAGTHWGLPESSSIDPLLNTYMTAASMSEVSRRTLALFKHLDIDNNGSLSYAELSEGLKVSTPSPPPCPPAISCVALRPTHARQHRSSLACLLPVPMHNLAGPCCATHANLC